MTSLFVGLLQICIFITTIITSLINPFLLIFLEHNLAIRQILKKYEKPKYNAPLQNFLYLVFELPAASDLKAFLLKRVSLCSRFSTASLSLHNFTATFSPYFQSLLFFISFFSVTSANVFATILCYQSFISSIDTRESLHVPTWNIFHPKRRLQVY